LGVGCIGIDNASRTGN